MTRIKKHELHTNTNSLALFYSHMAKTCNRFDSKFYIALQLLLIFTSDLLQLASSINSCPAVQHKLMQDNYIHHSRNPVI